MELLKMADIVIERLEAMGTSALILAEAGKKGSLEKSYKLLTENPEMTLDEFVELMGIEEE